MLVEALRQPQTPNMLPLIIFLTDQPANRWRAARAAIRSAVVAANTHKRRIFSFGVGFDVNAPLLTSIANDTRASSSFVFPNENVEAKVSQVFRRLSGPVLADPQLVSLDSSGAVATRAVRELMPAQLNDVFEGDQIVLLGQYQNNDADKQALHFRVNGNYLGQPRTFDFQFDLSKATTRNAFVPRLWASRKIALLVEEITKAGADGIALRGGANTMVAGNISSYSSRSAGCISAGGHTPRPGGAAPQIETEELVDGSFDVNEFGVLTEYTRSWPPRRTDFRNSSAERASPRSLVTNAQNTRSVLSGVARR